MRATALVFSARLGAGHDGASRELARRIEARGGRAVVVDFLDAIPRPLAVAWEHVYELQLRHLPESYESSYQLFYRYPALWGPFVRFQRALAGGGALRLVEEVQPDVVVSTFAFATLVLGRLREEGRLRAPVATFLTDFAVHPRTVHPAVDLHLAIHPIAAEAVRAAVGVPAVATGPAIDPRFGPDPSARRAMRDQLGIGADEVMVLVTCGSWGVGTGVERTVRALHADGRFRVVTVCGRDGDLRRRLASAGLGTPLGWTDQMPALVAAADVLVENAGGLSSLEAFATGVPTVSYEPIPGHGRDNVATMERAGVTTVPAGEAALLDAVARLARHGPEREAQVAAASAMFVEDPTERILALVGARETAGSSA